MSIRFVMLGDVGNYSQSLKSAINNANADAFVLLGDNFYPRGLSNRGISQFKETFNGKERIPKYMILGNHDYLGNIKPILQSSLWQMPTFCYAIETEHYHMIMIDTQHIESSWLPYDFLHSEGLKRRIEQATGVNYSTLKNQQLAKLEAFLSIKNGKPKIVCGHYHLKSNGMYGDNRKLRQILMPLFTKYNVLAYICGHEHIAQHSIINHNGKQIHQFITAAASETRPFVTRRDPGFTSIDNLYLAIDSNAKTIRFSFIRCDDNRIVYSTLFHT